MNEPTPRFDHLVLRLLSKTLAGRLPSLPLAVAVAMGSLVQFVLVLEKPSTLNSVILAQLFRVFPLTVILTYLPVVPPGKIYVSEERVVPLLLPVNTFVKVVPSFETDITKLFCRVFPLYHAITTLQMFMFDPKSAW